MVTAFQSTRHRQTYQTVLSALRRLGYSGDRLQENYTFGDWFLADWPQRHAPAAAFGYSPPSYDNACAAVLIPNGVAGASHVSQYRALGAPLAFEVHEDSVSVWRVGRDEKSTTSATRVAPDQIPAVFNSNAHVWSGEAILRAKNVVEQRGGRQLDFVDVGLIPALEEQIRGRLNTLFHDVLSRTERAYRKAVGGKADEQQLFRLVFRLLAAKVLHDRGAEGFESLSVSDGAPQILRAVRQFYKQNEEVLESPAAQEVALQVLWGGVGFQNLSVDTLAYVYENTLVSESSRQRLGTHSTPSSVARYLVQRLPFEDVPQDKRFVVEPCSGHCVLLTAAMKRLRQLLPPNMTPAKRHAYFVQMLRGFETDLFAYEVGKLCLMLADFPNANGWQLENRDVFVSRSFTDSLKEARFVVCNPPFEDFNEEERERYTKRRSLKKPVELLTTTLDHLHPEGTLAFVLPRQFIDGTAYADVRRRLAQRFREIEVVALPDRIFHVSKTESALLVARSPVVEGERTTVAFSEVLERDREGFLRGHTVSRRDVQTKTPDEAADTLTVPLLWDVWAALSSTRKLGDVADLHRGIEWRKFNEDTCYSETKKPGFRRGFTKVRNDLVSYVPLRSEYLNVEPRNLLYSAIDRPWDQPKTVINAARVSRGPWRLAAFVDRGENVCSQQFTGVWPSAAGITSECLAAVLNGPLANAYVSATERGRHNQIRTLKAIPVPAFDARDWQRLADMVRQYERLSGTDTGQRAGDEELRESLFRIDAFVMSGYNLPPRLERKILRVFDRERRPVSCEFVGYDVEEFAVHRAVAGSNASPGRITQLRDRRGVLAQKLIDKTLTAAEDRELSELDAVLDRYSDMVAPLPFDLLEQLEGEARLSGVDLDAHD